MQSLQFPITFSFKLTSLANDFIARDARGQVVGYVRQKMFKFKEDIEVFSDENRSRLNYRIKADRWIDFSAAYAFIDAEGREFGKIARKGWRSMWKAEYEIIDQHDKMQYHIREENGWVKVMDHFFGELPIIGLLSGYVFNPAYLVTDMQGQHIVRISKEPSLFGKEFKVEKLGSMDSDDDDRVMLGLMMMILLERRRG